MTMNEITIIPYTSAYRTSVLECAINAWEPVFKNTRNEVPEFVYDNFWPQGWRNRQIAEIESLLDAKPEELWLAFKEKELVGFVGISIHPEDQMGEVSIIAVVPKHQRTGIGKALMAFAERHIRERGMKMVMVETVGDSGHEPARRTYESLGYERWPVVRYFKKL